MLRKQFQMMKEERGNALFLILIAVALFAALSYAITQSGRGSGTVDKETAMITSGQVTQYPASIRTAVTRMIITGTPATSIKFDTTASVGIFAADGGGVAQQDPPASAGSGLSWDKVDVSACAATGMYIDGVGTDTDVTGCDGLFYLEGISKTVCEQILKGLGQSLTIGTNTNDVTAAAATKTTTNDFDGASGEAFSCVDNDKTAAASYTYYHAIIEQ